MIPAVRSIRDLHSRAMVSNDYLALAFKASRNLGHHARTLDDAIRWLRLNAEETEDEQGVVEEINACR